MAQQQINFGAFPDDLNADAIRTAFEKVEQNFTDLYSGNNVSGVSKIIAGRGIVLQGTTTGAGNVTVSAQIFQVNINSSTLVVTGSPLTSGSSNITIDFNSNNFQVGNLFASNSINFGNVTSSVPVISNVGGVITLGSPTTTIDGTYISNVTVKTSPLNIGQIQVHMVIVLNSLFGQIVLIINKH